MIIDFSVSDLVGKIEAKISQLEDANRAAKASFEASKGNETNFAKQCLEAQRNLQSMSEKHDKLVQLLKDRKNEMKKLEKKAKSEM
jgi:hypothetical protein